MPDAALVLQQPQVLHPVEALGTQGPFQVPCSTHTGCRGPERKNVVLDLGPSIGQVQYQWADGPELHIQAPESAIERRYGPYENLPRVVLTHP